MAEAEFDAWAVVVDKAKLADSFRVMRPLEFYLYFVSETIQMIPAEKRDGATLLLDEFGLPKQLPVELRRVLKARSFTSFRQIVARRSHSEPLIQVADLLAGALLRHVVQGESESYQTIASKLRQVKKSLVKNKNKPALLAEMSQRKKAGRNNRRLFAEREKPFGTFTHHYYPCF